MWTSDQNDQRLGTKVRTDEDHSYIYIHNHLQPKESHQHITILNNLKTFINIWFAIQRLNKYILYVKGLSKGTLATQSVNWIEMYKWKGDMKYPGYQPDLVCAYG